MKANNTAGSATTHVTATPPSPAADHSRSSSISPLVAILSLLVFIAITALIYAFVFVIECPQNSFRRRRRPRSARRSPIQSNKAKEVELVSKVKYLKEANGGECPVCLSMFVEGEEIKQVNACKHAFHIACIDKWLDSHSSCPVCRASIAIRNSKRPMTVQSDTDNDFRHGLPDSSSLV